MGVPPLQLSGLSYKHGSPATEHGSPVMPYYDGGKGRPHARHMLTDMTIVEMSDTSGLHMSAGELLRELAGI